MKVHMFGLRTVKKKKRADNILAGLKTKYRERGRLFFENDISVGELPLIKHKR